MKSLLDILAKEKELVDLINRYEDYKCIFENEIREITMRLDYVSYELQEADINRVKSRIENIDKYISLTERELETVRLEIRKYFKELR